MTAALCPGCEGTVVRHAADCIWVAHHAVGADSMLRVIDGASNTYRFTPPIAMEWRGNTLVRKPGRFAWLRAALWDAVTAGERSKYVVTAVDQDRGTVTLAAVPR